MYRVWVSGNYFFVQDFSNDLLYEAHRKSVFITRLDINSTEFYFKNINGFNDARIDFSNLVDYDGNPFKGIEDFIEWYTKETGNF